MWDYGRVYVKEGTEERRFFCQITKACREGDGVVGPTCIAFTGTTNSNAMNHLAIHGISSKKTIALVAHEAAAAAAKKRRNDDLAGATKAGNRDRWLKLSFVKTWTIGQFSPFVLGEKRDIRNFLTDIGACRSGVGEEQTIDDSTDAPPSPPPLTPTTPSTQTPTSPSSPSITAPCGSWWWTCSRPPRRGSRPRLPPPGRRACPPSRS